MRRDAVIANLRDWAGDLADLEARFVRTPSERLYYHRHPEKAAELRLIHHTLRTAADMLAAKDKPHAMPR